MTTTATATARRPARPARRFIDAWTRAIAESVPREARSMSSANASASNASSRTAVVTSNRPRSTSRSTRGVRPFCAYPMAMPMPARSAVAAGEHGQGGQRGDDRCRRSARRRTARPGPAGWPAARTRPSRPAPTVATATTHGPWPVGPPADRTAARDQPGQLGEDGEQAGLRAGPHPGLPPHRPQLRQHRLRRWPAPDALRWEGVDRCRWRLQSRTCLLVGEPCDPRPHHRPHPVSYLSSWPTACRSIPQPAVRHRRRP